MSGFIALHRKLIDWEWYSDINTTRLFIHLLLTVNWEDKKWHGLIIKRGQIITSLPHLSEQTGLSIQNIRTSISNLKSTGELTDKVTNKFRLISIVKYDDYQQVFNKSTDKLTGKLTGNQQQLNKYNKTINNIFMSYKQNINLNSKLTTSAKQKIITRLKTYSEEDLLSAITNFSSSPWWMENNSGRGIAWFFNSDDRIEQFLNLKGFNNSTLVKF